MRDRILTGTALLCAGAAIAIISWLGGADWQGQTIQPGLNDSSTLVSAVSTVAWWETPRVVIVVTPTPPPTPLPTETSIPYPTKVPVPQCLEGVAYPGKVCLEPFPTIPPAIQTPIQIHVEGEATPGQLYIWPRVTENLD